MRRTEQHVKFERERERQIIFHQSSTDIDSMHSMHGPKIFQAEAKVPAAHSRKVAHEVCRWELPLECFSKNSSKVKSSLEEWDVVSNCTFGDRYKPPQQSACIRWVEQLRLNGKNYQHSLTKQGMMQLARYKMDHVTEKLTTKLYKSCPTWRRTWFGHLPLGQLRHEAILHPSLINLMAWHEGWCRKAPPWHCHTPWYNMMTVMTADTRMVALCAHVETICCTWLYLHLACLAYMNSMKYAYAGRYDTYREMNITNHHETWINYLGNVSRYCRVKSG